MRLGHNSTIIRREKICKSCGRPCYPFSKGRCQPCATQEDTTKRMEKEVSKMIVEEDLSGLIEDADRVISQYVRLKNADENGIVACYTCGLKKHWSLQQAGHYIKRANLYLRWDEGRNIRIQCVGCNEVQSGNMIVYSQKLDAECKGLPDLLRDEARLVHKPTRDEIRAIISEYSPKLKELKKRLNK